MTGKRLRFFIASGCPHATTTQYRAIHLREQLEALGHEAELHEWFSEDKVSASAADRSDAVILYRLPLNPELAALIQRARDDGKPVWFDVDDLVFAPELLSWHRAVADLSPEDQQQHAADVARYEQGMRSCDLTITATPELARLAEERDVRAVVHRNALGREMMSLAQELRRTRRGSDGSVVIGYGSGTATHDKDFEEVAPALSMLLGQPQVKLVVAGPVRLPDVLGPFVGTIEMLPLMSWQNWFRVMNRFDIALAPLEMDNVFCRAKSEIKFVEAGALGIPLVASRVGAFGDVIRSGENGFLAANEDGWLDALTRLISDPGLRHRIGEGAYETVLEQFAPEVRSAQLGTLLSREGIGVPLVHEGRTRS